MYEREPVERDPARRKPDHILGLDLGQQQDFTALAVLERTWRPDPETKRHQGHYAVRHLKRWPLGTPNTQIVADVGQLVRTPPLNNPLVAVDSTGVGQAVVEMFQPVRPFARLRPILITGGHETVGLHTPKKELVGTLQVLLQSRRLKIAPLPERGVLAKEFLAFRVKVTASAHETFEAWRERDHDDLVLAVALAAWLGELEGGPLLLPAPDPEPERKRSPMYHRA
jgi:hypothetical protein